jgi:hypothetical protein
VLAGRPFARDDDHRAGDGVGFDRPVLAGAPEENAGDEPRGGDPELFGGPLFGPAAHEERRPENVKSIEAQPRDGVLGLALYAAVEDARLRVGADRADEEEAVRSGAEGGLREAHDVFVVDLPERRLGAGLLHRGAEAAEHVLPARKGRHAGEAIEIDRALLEPLVHDVERPAHERDDLFMQTAGQKAAQAVPAHEPAGARDDGRASRHDAAHRLYAC